MSTHKLMFSVLSNNLPNVKSEINRGISANAVDNEVSRYSALHLAVDHGHKDITIFLLESGADPNAQDNREYTPLHLVIINAIMARDQAKRSNFITIAKILLRYNADVNIKSKYNTTPRQKAQENSEVYKILFYDNDEEDNSNELDPLLSNYR
jgi:ankyrin repeat protein